MKMLVVIMFVVLIVVALNSVAKACFIGYTESRSIVTGGMP